MIFYAMSILYHDFKSWFAAVILDHDFKSWSDAVILDHDFKSWSDAVILDHDFKSGLIVLDVVLLLCLDAMCHSHSIVLFLLIGGFVTILLC